MIVLHWLANHSQQLANLAQAGGIFVAVMGGVFALVKYRSDVGHRNWLDAKALYVAVLDDQIADPRLRGENWSEFAKTDLDFRYKFSTFVNKMLWSLEGMLVVGRNKKEWEDSAFLLVESYFDYLCSENFNRERHIYSSDLTNIIDAYFKKRLVTNAQA